MQLYRSLHLTLSLSDFHCIGCDGGSGGASDAVRSRRAARSGGAGWRPRTGNAIHKNVPNCMVSLQKIVHSYSKCFVPKSLGAVLKELHV